MVNGGKTNGGLYHLWVLEGAATTGESGGGAATTNYGGGGSPFG